MNRKYLVTLSIIITIITIVGLSYAYFTANITGAESETTIIVEAGRMEITYVSDTGNININNIVPGYEVTKTFRVIGNNTTSNKMYYKFGLYVVNNTFSEGALKYSLARDPNSSNNGSMAAAFNNRDIPNEVGVSRYFGGYFDEANNQSHIYKLTISFPNKNEDQSIEQGKTFAGYIKLESDLRPKTWNNTTPGDGSLLGAIKRDNTVTPYASLPTTPGAAISGESESELSSAKDDDGDSYFFRGAGNLVNNWVKFGKDASNGDIYWRIIRVNGDGSIRLIYNGPNTNQTGSTTQIQTSTFSPNFVMNYLENAKYVSYTYLAAENNLNTETNSIAKTNLEAWYNNNFGASSRNAALAEYIVDGTFCNDKSYSSKFEDAEWTDIFYGVISRTNTPSYKCPAEISENIAATTTTNKYTLKVGLITADEAAYAGGRRVYTAISQTYWLNINQDYWTITPYSMSKIRPIVSTVDYNGRIIGELSKEVLGLRPVINLSSSTFVRRAGNGTASNPYVVTP